MPATAQQIRKRNQAFDATVNGVDVRLKRPDIRLLIYTQTMPAPLLDKVSKVLQQWVGQDLTKLSEEVKNTGGDALDVLNFLVSVCLIQPKCVVGTSEDPEVLGTDEMDVDFKENLIIRSLVGPQDPAKEAERKAAARFSGQQPSEGTGEDVQPVRAEAVVGAADPGPGSSTGL